MDDLEASLLAQEIQNTEHLDLVIFQGSYGIFKDSFEDIYYFARIDKFLNPLELFNGEKEDISIVFDYYASSGRIVWEILKDYS